MGRRRIQRCTTPELKDVLLDSTGGRWFRPINGYDEVFPGILLGDADTALATNLLKDIGVTHVLNAAQGHNNEIYRGYVSTSANYYKKKGIFYLGIPAMDMPGFYLKPYFREAADFISRCLQQGGKVLVHCQCGISRSAAVVAGFLMLRRGMNVQTALNTISKKRSIFPNQGFLSQLCDLDYELRRSGDIADVELPDRRPSTYRETSPFRNPSAYPRFTLVPHRSFETYTDTRNYVVPRRSSSVDRYETPVKPFAHNPLVESKTYQRTRSTTSPVRYTRSPSVSYTKSFIDDDEDEEPMNPKVFDTYKRYVRSSTAPLPSALYRQRLARILDYYTPPRNILYDLPSSNTYTLETYYPERTYHYLNNLNKYYDPYRYRETSPVRAYSPVPERRSYDMVPLRGYHSVYSAKRFY